MFEVSGDDIAQLVDADLRILVARLARAELGSRGGPISCITAGGDQDAPDGGLDVRIECPAQITNPDFVPRSLTGFQVKKSNMPASAIADEMRPNGALRSVIREIVDRSGAYVIVSAQGSLADKPLADRRKAMRAALHDIPNAPQVHTDFYDRDRLATWANEYIGVAAWIRSRIGKPLSGWSGIVDCDGRGANHRESYLVDDRACLIDQSSFRRDGVPISEGIARMRARLREAQQCIRLVGLSGLGKTRLVQALFEEGIGDDPLDPALAVYTDYSEDIRPSAREMARDLVDRGQRAILIVDNCNPATHADLARVCASSASKVSLITVEYDVGDDEPERTEVFRLNPVSPELVTEWLKQGFPNISQIDRERIVEFSDSNFRLARALAETVRKGDTLGRLRDRELFGRIFHQRNVPDQQLLRAAEDLSILYSIDGEDTSPGGELAHLGSIRETNPTQLYEALVELGRRGLVQSRGRYRAVLPHAVANRLAAQALERVPPPEFDRFCAASPARMLKSVSRRLGYLHDSAVAQATVMRWLEPRGPLGDLLARDDGLQVITNFAPVAPKAVLTRLEQELRTQSGSMLLDPGARNRYQWIRLIKLLGYEVNAFETVVGLLVRFACVEPEGNNTNSAHHSLTELFHIHLSGTQASPEQRREAVKRLALSDDPPLRRIASSVLDALLETDHFVSSGDIEFGARSRDWGWQPKISKDAWDWYEGAIALAIKLESNLSDARSILARHVRGLWRFRTCHDLLERASTIFSEKGTWIEGWLAFRVVFRFDKEKMPEEYRGRLLGLIARLNPSDLLNRARAIVLNRSTSGWDLADGELDEKGPTRAWERAAEMALEIGRLLAHNVDVRRTFLRDMLREPYAQRAWNCGKGLAEGAEDLGALWRELVLDYGSEQSDVRNPTVLQGYLSGVYRLNEGLARSMVEAAIDDPNLAPILPRLQASVSMDEDGLCRLRRAFAKGVLPTKSLYAIANGSVLPAPPEPLAALLEDIAAHPEGVPVALDILHMRFHGDRRDERERDAQLIEVGRAILTRIDFGDIARDTDYRMEVVARACLAGESGRAAAAQLCANARRTLEGAYLSLHGVSGTLKALFETQPIVALDTFLLPQPAQRSPRLFNTHFDMDTPIAGTDPAIVREWADRDASGRYPILGQILGMFGRNGGEEGDEILPIFRSLLDGAPDKRQFLGNLRYRVQRGSSSGSLSEILIRRKLRIASLADHPDVEVRTWVAEALPALDAMVAEERDGERKSEESFE